MKTVPDFAQAMADAQGLEAGRVRITHVMSFVEGLYMLRTFQLGLRHPEIPLDAREAGERCARRLQQLLSVTPALASAAEVGWDPEFDVECRPPGARARAAEATPPGIGIARFQEATALLAECHLTLCCSEDETRVVLGTPGQFRDLIIRRDGTWALSD